jgi:opacity protein-like surface antigen
MRRVAFPALALLMSLAGRMLSAQAPDPTGTVLRIGVGADKMDITCGECQIDAERGISAFIAASRPIGGGFTAGLEASFANAAFETNTVSEDYAWLWGAMATAGLRGGAGLPVWGTLGLGWVLYSGIGPNSSGPALSLRAGGDLGVGSLGFVSPHAGYVTMLGHDGPEVGTTSDPTVLPQFDRSRVSSFQLGIAWTPKL